MERVVDAERRFARIRALDVDPNVGNFLVVEICRLRDDYCGLIVVDQCEILRAVEECTHVSLIEILVYHHQIANPRAGSTVLVDFDGLIIRHDVRRSFVDVDDADNDGILNARFLQSTTVVRIFTN